MRRIAVEPGARYGRLTLIGEGPRHRQPSGQIKRQFNFRCDCGNEIMALPHNVRAGKIQSCGCLNQENRTSHGLANHPAAKLWYGMHDRCTHRDDYAGHGIKVCPEWSGEAGLRAFVVWAETSGYRQGLEIDREDNDGAYAPGNCRFVPRSINQRNKRDALKVSHPQTREQVSLLTLWEEEGNPDLVWETVRQRYLYRGYSPLDAITKPKRGQS